MRGHSAQAGAKIITPGDMIMVASGEGSSRGGGLRSGSSVSCIQARPATFARKHVSRRRGLVGGGFSISHGTAKETVDISQGRYGWGGSFVVWSLPLSGSDDGYTDTARKGETLASQTV